MTSIYNRFEYQSLEKQLNKVDGSHKLAQAIVPSGRHRRSGCCGMMSLIDLKCTHVLELPILE